MSIDVRRQCRAILPHSDGTRCPHWAMPDGILCVHHGGMAHQVQQRCDSALAAPTAPKHRKPGPAQ